jgi:hypothetical protein
MLAGVALIGIILYMHSAMPQSAFAQPSTTITITGDPDAIFAPKSVSIVPSSEVIWQNSANKEIENIWLEDSDGNQIYNSGPIANGGQVSYFFDRQSTGIYAVCFSDEPNSCGAIIVT